MQEVSLFRDHRMRCYEAAGVFILGSMDSWMGGWMDRRIVTSLVSN